MDKIYGFASSGGGSKGAWGAGVSHFLIKDLKRDYKYLSGTSTGALLINLVALHRTDMLKEAYTSVSNDDIYTVAPYRVKKSKNGTFKTKMNYLKVGWNIFIRGQKTFGDSTKVREELIPKFFKEKDFDLTRTQRKELIACVTNLTKGISEYKSSLDYEYEDFLDWVFASTCAAPFMSILEKDKSDYADGGYIEHIPIQTLIDRGCTDIDIIDHSDPEFDIERIRNPLHLIERIIKATMWEAAKTDFQMVKLNAKEHDVNINIYKPDRKLTNNSLVFNKQLMSKWWEEGYDYARYKKCKSFTIYKDARKGIKPIK